MERAGIVRVVERAYLDAMDTATGGSPEQLSKRRGNAGVKIRIALLFLCEVQSRDPAEVYLTVAEIARIDDGAALKWLAAQAVTELEELGYREQIAAEMAELEAEADEALLRELDAEAEADEG